MNYFLPVLNFMQNNPVSMHEIRILIVISLPEANRSVDQMYEIPRVMFPHIRLFPFVNMRSLPIRRLL